jgi:high-affinity Fe2+/Pb2+ permease
MDQRKPSKDEQDFVRVVKIATALGMGLMAGFLFSLKQVHPSIRLEFGFGTVVAFTLTAIFSWMFCGVLFRSEFDEGDSAHAARVRKRRVARWIVFFVTVSSLATAGAFLYSLKDISSESRREVIQGTLMAVVVLFIGGFLIYKAVHFFEEQDRISLEDKDDERDRDS